MKEVLVIIDTADNKQIKVGLRIDGKEHLMDRPLDRKKAQVVLPLLQELLQEHNLTLQDITAIEVNPGPGSFTGLRVGVTIANTLATVLQVPINKKKVGELVIPVYV
jgi:tRNA threonylcarbamoyladenosine biosynthesis protein TsaB